MIPGYGVSDVLGKDVSATERADGQYGRIVCRKWTTGRRRREIVCWDRRHERHPARTKNPASMIPRKTRQMMRPVKELTAAEQMVTGCRQILLALQYKRHSLGHSPIPHETMILAIHLLGVKYFILRS